MVHVDRAFPSIPLALTLSRMLQLNELLAPAIYNPAADSYCDKGLTRLLFIVERKH